MLTRVIKWLNDAVTRNCDDMSMIRGLFASAIGAGRCSARHGEIMTFCLNSSNNCLVDIQLWGNSFENYR